MFQALGLSSGHEAVYRTMLDHPDLDVAGLAAHLAIDSKEVHAALDVLADLTLIRIDSGTGRAQALRPATGLSALLAKVEADIAIRQRQIEAVRVTLASIATEQQESEPVVRLEGVEAVRDRLIHLAHTAQTECLSFSPGGAQSSDAIIAEAPLNEAALRRGVRIRNVYQESFRNDPSTLAHARAMAALGSQSRTVPTLPMRMVIVDQEIALVPIDPEDARTGALEVRTPGVIAGLLALFEQVWQTGTAFGETPATTKHGLTPQEQAVLRLLADGHTDESAARGLAVSPRSIQRIMNLLAEKLNATSRFQAGVEAARRGWI